MKNYIDYVNRLPVIRVIFRLIYLGMLGQLYAKFPSAPVTIVSLSTVSRQIKYRNNVTVNNSMSQCFENFDIVVLVNSTCLYPLRIPHTVLKREILSEKNYRPTILRNTIIPYMASHRFIVLHK